MTSEYRDSEGNKCTLRQLVIKEPDWAVSRLTVGRYSQNDLDIKLDDREREVKQWCAEATLAAIDTMSYDDGISAVVRSACSSATRESAK